MAESTPDRDAVIAHHRTTAIVSGKGVSQLGMSKWNPYLIYARDKERGTKMYILIIQALIEHPVINKPHRIIATYPVIKENENTRAVIAEPGYVIVAVQMIDDKAAETYNPQPPRVPMYYTSPQYLGGPRPDPVSHDH